MIDTSRPSLLQIYLPTGEVDVLEGCTQVSHTDGLLRFTDKKGMVTITSLPFMMFFNPEEKTDA